MSGERHAAWIGRTETTEDRINRSPLQALAATLDVQPPDDAVPPLWHWIYFTPKTPGHQLGDDGHPRRGGFLPPIELPRRMWAGGRLTWHAPLRIDDAVRRRSTITNVVEKSGRSGALVFVTVRHEIEGPRGLALVEEQDIVYRDAPAAGSSAAAAKFPQSEEAAPETTFSSALRCDPVRLFRYSALTFNAHRIHYDRPYAEQVEGYPGLVVHGPLVATLLAELVRAHQPARAAARFEFKALQPLFDTEPFTVCGRDHGDRIELWAADPHGRAALQAHMDFTTT